TTGRCGTAAAGVQAQPLTGIDGIGFTQTVVRGQSLPVPAIAEGDGIQGVTPLNHMVTTGYLLGAIAAPAAIVHRYSAGGTGAGRYQQGHEHEPGYAGSADTRSEEHTSQLQSSKNIV